MNNKTFIRCSDKETIKELERLGYQKVSDSNGVAVFLNDTKKPHAFAKNKVVYSNIMTIT